MAPKITRDQAIEKIAVLEAQLKTWQDKDVTMREQLSSTLDAPYVKKSHYSDSSERITYSWYQIFREIGRLLVREDYARYVNDIASAHSRIETLQSDLTNHIDQQRMDTENKRFTR